MKKILIIEDDEFVRTNIQQLLEEFGYEIISSANGLEGVLFAERYLPDLIICDIMMPEKDGYDVLRELSSKPETASIPFVFLTAKAEINDIRFGMQLGADDYLLKPFTSGDLLKAIELRLSKRMLIRQNELAKLKPESNKEKQMPDYNSHLFLLVGDRPEVVKVSKIKYILAESEYSRVYTTDDRKIIVRRLLKEWEEILPSEYFLRIHRSTIINIEYIRKIEKWFNHSFRVHVDGAPDPFIVSRRFSSKLRGQISVN